MKIKFPHILLFFPTSLMLLFFVSCGPAVLPATETPTATQILTASATIMLTDPLVCDGLCPDESMTATAAMGSTLAAIPSNTPPPWATIHPTAGNLGWGSVYGIIVDGVTGLPLEGATVTCEHFSYTSPYLCNGITITNKDGVYSFTPVFFHDTDRITLLVEATSYTPLRFEQSHFTQPEFNANLGLFPEDYGTQTPTPSLACTPPPCLDGILTCGVSSGCPGGCGMICIPATSTP